MKGLKKAAAFALAAALITGVSACGKEEQPENQKPEQPQMENEVQTEEVEEEETEASNVESQHHLFSYEEVDGGISITAYKGTTEVLNIPDELDGMAVVAISEYAFRGEDMQEVTIPDSVQEIGKEAFVTCDKMERLDLGNGVERIGESAFQGASALKEVVLPASLTVVERAAFGGSLNLEKAEMLGAVESIPNVLFALTKLQSFTIPDGVKSIGGSAFGGCSELKELYIPASVTEIEEDAVEDSPNVVIYGEAGSYAETFANEMSLPFQAK